MGLVCKRLQLPLRGLPLWFGARLLLGLCLLSASPAVRASGIVQPGAAAGAIAYEPQALSTINLPITSTGSTDIVNVTEAGKLLEVGIFVNVAVTGTFPAVDIDITVDGGTTRSVILYIGTAQSFDAPFLAVAAKIGTGGAPADTATLILGTPYKTSLQVAINVTTAAGTTGTITAAVLRGVEL